jgi:hypothetical protein
MSSTAVLILAAGQLPDRQLGPAPLLHPHPIDLPAGSDLALQRIATYHRHQHPQAQLVAVVDQDSHCHYQCLEQLVDEWLPIPPQPSVGASLHTALQQLQTQQVVVNPITSLPNSGPLPATSVVLGDAPLQRQNWSAFCDPWPNSRRQLLSKLTVPDPAEPSSFPFTGLLAAKRLALLQVLEQLSADQQRDLGWVAALLIEQHGARVLQAPWHDLGHRACYARSRRSQLVSRSHNRVDYDPVGDLIRKRSSDQSRLAAEATYLQNLPPRLRRHFPALLDHTSSQGMELEYVPFPSLAELFLHWQIGPDGWAGIWQRLGDILSELGGCEAPIRASCSWLFSHKLQQRLQQLEQCPPHVDWGNFWNTPLQLNGHALPAPSRCAALVLEALKGLEGERLLQRIHGDLCFNNILAEPLHAALRLIDPRGETPAGLPLPVGYGDPRYDLVKLLHSGCYLYDVAVHGLFQLHGSPGGLWQASLVPPLQATLVADQVRAFVRNRGLSPEEERWLTASLFFSMLPLHSDSLQRQMMLALIGCCIAADAFPLLLP